MIFPTPSLFPFCRDCVNGSKVFLNPQGYCSRTQGCTPHASCSGLAPLPEEHLAVGFVVTCHGIVYMYVYFFDFVYVCTCTYIHVFYVCVSVLW